MLAEEAMGKLRLLVSHRHRPRDQADRPDTRLLVRPRYQEPEIPGTGKEADHSFEILLPTEGSGPYVAVAAPAGTIRIPREHLEALAGTMIEKWKTEEERLLLIQSRQARLLLEKVADGAGAPPVELNGLGEALHLVAGFVEAGLAVIVRTGSEVPFRRVVVRYVGTHPGPLAGIGHILVSADGVRLFDPLPWFVA
jgi:hypothetical protein